MITEGCASCRFWKQLDPDGDSADADGGYEVTEFGTGLCRRLPPASRRTELESSLNSMDAARTAFWPVTWDEDWCGEFETRAGKSADARRAARAAARSWAEGQA